MKKRKLNSKNPKYRSEAQIKADEKPIEKQVLIKDANGTAIKARTGLAATGASTFKTEKSDGTALKTLVGPFVDALPEITTPSGNVIMDASAADTDIGDEILLESGSKVNLEHATQTT